MNARSARLAPTLLVATLLLAACTNTSSAVKPSPVTSDLGATRAQSAASPGAVNPVRLRVMTFNIENGGTGVDFASVSKAIEAARADVVAINEGYGNIPRLARDLGWPYYDLRTQVVSRFPLLNPPGSRFALRPGAQTTDGRAVLVEVAPGRVAAVINVHLPAIRYSPFKIQQGASARQVVAVERRIRVSALQRPLATARNLIAQDVPTFLLGDFNSPSDLDWTKATVGRRDQIKFPLRWPASAAVEAAGMVDSYRMVHPDPVSEPGLTWPANRPFVKGYNPARGGQAADRIDLLFSGGPARATRSSLVGERGSTYSDIVVSPWPSDHRAVVSQFEVIPAPAPTLLSVRSRLLVRGRPLVVDYSAADANAHSIVVTAAGGTSTALADQPVDRPANGTIVLDSRSLEPGAYVARLTDGAGALLAQMTFWVEAPGSKPAVTTGSASYRRGDPVAVSWKNAPGNRNDWLAVFRHGGVPGADSYLGWTYIGAKVAGSTTLDSKINGNNWPLPPGRYSVYLLKDDGYDVLAGTDFVVR